MPDLSGKVIIVTGGNAGIGYETVKALLKKNAKVYLAAQSQDKAEKAIASLKQETGREAIFLKLNLGDLASIKPSAEEFLSKEKKLDVLFNNAGVMTPPTGQLTESGYDLQWGTNVLGPYYFTNMLIPALKASKSASGTPSRVINTSSLAHAYAPTSAPNKVWEVDSFVGSAKRDALIKKWGEYGARSALYGQSKAGNIAHANYLGREYAGDIVACSLHPGMINSELQRHLPGFVASIVRWMSYPLTMCALTQLNTGTILTPEEINGKYYQPWGRVGRPTPQSNDPARADEVHQLCEAELAKGKFRSPAGPILLMPLK
ncbi:BZ3500_MvSof-1268-A1-R1_Chr8-2g10143 [Microbotryum saponariae]|uniref:BZ3500_MvSof-1268-A1-R1_Chr8-2g10143 protein n=1 Tax=Microbotryum saponariae TaxID=289078 RepID=A0A2X0NA96_9BASI|nr:BZ3500_MvSof-1268-A1-R1_Chr8-2g10143 [Microbotryum saponariae]SDA01867.1 BZ3501_MvSof-1269-A2-R1_Chr8-2g09894 [Microbotryum saponariae]